LLGVQKWPSRLMVFCLPSFPNPDFQIPQAFWFQTVGGLEVTTLCTCYVLCILIRWIGCLWWHRRRKGTCWRRGFGSSSSSCCGTVCRVSVIEVRERQNCQRREYLCRRELWTWAQINLLQPPWCDIRSMPESGMMGSICRLVDERSRNTKLFGVRKSCLSVARTTYIWSYTRTPQPCQSSNSSCDDEASKFVTKIVVVKMPWLFVTM